MRFQRTAYCALVTLIALTGCGSADKEAVEQSAANELPSGVTLLESVERHDSAGDAVVIPYTKYRLDNGLTVILHEDRSDPLVHVDVTYHVGSAREEIGKSGFAHLFEHMMFQGSENVADEEHFKIISEAGGTLNGTTNADRTNYFETVPANQLEKMLWLEADRMGFLLDAVTQEKFEVQRETVKNERGQRIDNQPYGRLNERVSEALYPQAHPYSWPTIGHMVDLDRVNVNDLKKFFLRWYGPNNAILTIGGHFDTTETLNWVLRYFASIPSGPAVAMPEKPVVTLASDRYISMEDNVALPLLYMAIPTVYARHVDEAPLDVLMSILGQGKTSLLYKNMIKGDIAVQAQAGHGCAELSCTFSVAALPNPQSGATLADLEKIVRDSLLEFEERGVLDDDLTRVKVGITSGMIYGLESVAGKVGQLASNETFTGNPNYIGDDIARYDGVTKEDVMRVYRQYIKGQPAVIMRVVPLGQGEEIAKTDTWERVERDLPDYVMLTDSDLELRIPRDDFDRSIMPNANANPGIELPPIWRDSLENGVKVLGAVNNETPTTAISLRIKAGQRHESLEKLGLAALTAAMMNEATLSSSNEELSNRLQKLGSSVSFASGNNETVLTVRSLSQNLDETLAIAAEKLLSPKFDEQDFSRLKSQTLQGIERSRKQAQVTANVVYQKLLLGEDNAIAYADIGITETVQELTVEDVRKFYRTHYSPSAGSIIAVSDMERAVLLGKLGVFKVWDGPAVPAAELKPFPSSTKRALYLVDKPDAAQSEIRIGKRSMIFDATGEYYRAGLMNFALGGAFNSRINLNLREDKGYTYGARTGFNAAEDYGVFTASAGVRSNVTAESIVEFEREIERYVTDGISESELLFTRNSIGQRDARKYETPRQKLGFLSTIMRYDLDSSFVTEQNEILDSISAAEIDALAQEYLSMDDMVIVVVGDKQSILPGLEGLGYEIVELSAEGKPL